MAVTTAPQLLSLAKPLGAYAQSLSAAQLQSTMQLSEALAYKVRATMAAWNTKPSQQAPAIDSFVGDIYSGLRAAELSPSDRVYAQQTLRILSGLYGVLRPLDGVRPYRLEMGYRLPDEPYKNLYTYWGRHIADTLPKQGIVVNLSAIEYTRAVLPYLDAQRVVTPRFLTMNQATHVPGQVVVHTKIARGAFARWLLSGRASTVQEMKRFADLNYVYAPEISTEQEPVFVCDAFGGIGLSVRPKKG